jgi:catalase
VTGVQSLWNETEIKEIAYANHKHATKDLYDSIAAGQFPKWKLSVQVMDPSNAATVSVTAWNSKKF